MNKRIVCLCTLTPPAPDTSKSEQVFSIFESARKFNKENQLVGIFLVIEDVLMQILEGESSAIANVIYRINRDPRVSDASVILNTSIDKTAFTRWNLKLLSENCEAHTEYVRKLLPLIQKDLSTKTNLDAIRLHKIFGEFEASPPAPEAGIDEKKPNFNDCLLTMKSWPRPTQLRLTAGLMKICPLLIGQTVTYQRLNELALFEHSDELDRHLEQLKNANALQIIPAQPPNNLHSFEEHQLKQSTKSGGNRFSQALKQFISGQGLKGVAQRD